MKDSFGGTIMIYILILFLGIYVVFIALTLRYAQSFRVKNKIIDVIEMYDGDKNNVKNDLKDYFNNNRNVTPNSIEINKIDNNDLKHTCYYTVVSKINWEWPFFNIRGQWRIKGETKSVSKCEDITSGEINSIINP